MAKFDFYVVGVEILTQADFERNLEMIIHERANGMIVESMRGEKAPRQAAEILAKSKFDYMLHAEIQKLKKEEDKK